MAQLEAENAALRLENTVLQQYVIVIPSSTLKGDYTNPSTHLRCSNREPK
jgi:hypothetical protein